MCLTDTHSERVTTMATFSFNFIDFLIKKRVGAAVVSLTF